MHENCKYSSIPKNNHEFWKNKLESMVIKVIVIWGCEIKQMMKDKVIEKEKTDYLANHIFSTPNSK